MHSYQESSFNYEVPGDIYEQVSVTTDVLSVSVIFLTFTADSDF